MKLYIYKLKRNEFIRYDDYDSCIVCAENIEMAKNILPWGETFYSEKNKDRIKWEWTNNKNNIKCECIGEANEDMAPGVILASYNAG